MASSLTRREKLWRPSVWSSQIWPVNNFQNNTSRGERPLGGGGGVSWTTFRNLLFCDYIILHDWTPRHQTQKASSDIWGRDQNCQIVKGHPEHPGSFCHPWRGSTSGVPGSPHQPASRRAAAGQAHHSSFCHPIPTCEVWTGSHFGSKWFVKIHFTLQFYHLLRFFFP